MINIALYWSILLLMFGAFAMPIIGHLTKKHFEARGLITYFIILFSFCLLLFQAPLIMAGNILVYQMGAWAAPYGIVLVVDGFNYLLALLITGSAALVALYSIEHIEVRTGLTKFYTLLILMTAGMLGVALTGDLFNLYVFFEIASISAYALVAFRSRNPASIEGGMKFLLTGALGTSLIWLGIVFLYGLTGTVNMADMAMKLQLFNGSIVPPLAFGLLLTGFGVKAVIVPMHAWKPDALVGATSEIAGLIAGGSTALGLYCIFRAAYTIFPPSIGIMSLLIVLGVVTMIVGALMALVQTDLKRLLAYSSVSQSGYVVLALGLAAFTATGAVAGMFHILNYVLAALLLFLCTGAVVFRTGSHDMNVLGGLGSKMPFTMFAFIIGVLAMVGLPPTNGLVSKLLIYIAGLEAGHPELTIIAMLVSLLTLMYMAKAVYEVFCGKECKTVHHPTEVHHLMLVPMFILVALCIIIGLFPDLAMKLVEPAAQAIMCKLNYVGAVLG